MYTNLRNAVIGRYETGPAEIVRLCYLAATSTHPDAPSERSIDTVHSNAWQTQIPSPVRIHAAFLTLRGGAIVQALIERR